MSKRDLENSICDAAYTFVAGIPYERKEALVAWDAFFRGAHWGADEWKRKADLWDLLQEGKLCLNCFNPHPEGGYCKCWKDKI